jgi:Tfp pilus assembly protein FimT
MTGWIRRTRMTAVLNQLVADIQYAKMLAVRSGQRVEVQMLPAGAACVTEYSIVIKSTPTRVAKRVPLPDAALGICLERTSPTTNLSFNTRGLPNAGRTFWVHHVHMADTLRLSMAGRLARAR